MELNEIMRILCGLYVLLFPVLFAISLERCGPGRCPCCGKARLQKMNYGKGRYIKECPRCGYYRKGEYGVHGDD